VSNFALAWATSRSNGSKTGIDVKPPQLRSLHTKPPSMRHGPRAGHHPTKQGAKSHKHGQQSAQQARTQSRNSAGGKHASHSRADTTPTPTPEETPTPIERSAPGASPVGTPLSSDVG
jgi:hypothetical protein